MTIVIKFNPANGDVQVETETGLILGSRPWQDPYDDIPIDLKGDMVTWFRDIFEDLGYEVTIEEWDE